MGWIIAGIALLISVPLMFILVLVALYHWLCRKYLSTILRIFSEKPLFIIPRGEAPPNAEDLRIETSDGLKISACYLKHNGEKRQGVIFFGLEFGANRWSCVPYCDHLLSAGYDIFAYEPRNQGDSDVQPGYDPLQWICDRDVEDCRAALRYLKSRPDADPRGIGAYGISKGGSACMAVAAEDPIIRCVLTDGAFSSYTTMVPYMRYWFSIYDTRYYLHGLLPAEYYGLIALKCIRVAGQERGVRFLALEKALKRIAPRPLFMIHGEQDSYIKSSMALDLFEHAREPKEFWMVSGARHNQALHLVPDEYRRRVREFFDNNLNGQS